MTNFFVMSMLKVPLKMGHASASTIKPICPPATPCPQPTACPKQTSQSSGDHYDEWTKQTLEMRKKMEEMAEQQKQQQKSCPDCPQPTACPKLPPQSRTGQWCQQTAVEHHLKCSPDQVPPCGQQPCPPQIGCTNETICPDPRDEAARMLAQFNADKLKYPDWFKACCPAHTSKPTTMPSADLCSQQKYQCPPAGLAQCEAMRECGGDMFQAMTKKLGHTPYPIPEGGLMFWNESACGCVTEAEHDFITRCCQHPSQLSIRAMGSQPE